MAKRRAKGEGSVYRQKSDLRWVAKYSLGVRPDGKRQTWKAYAPTQREARAKLDAFKEQVHRGEQVPNDRRTLGDFLTSWLTQTKRAKVRPHTFRGYEAAVRTRIIPALGGIRLQELRSEQIQSWVATQLQGTTIEHKGGGQTKPVAPRTIQLAFAILKSALQAAERWRLIARNPAAFVEPPRVPRTELGFLLPEEARAFLAAVRGDPLEALYTVALALGLRQGEALGLRWSDIDLERASLTVNVALQRIARAWALAEPKSKKSRRVLPLPAPTIAALRAHRERQLVARTSSPHWDNTWDLVFTSPAGAPLHSATVTHALQKHLDRAKLPRLRFHDLRHTCATLLLALDVPEREIMEILGHSQISVTLNLYTHVLPTRLRNATDRLSLILGSPLGPQSETRTDENGQENQRKDVKRVESRASRFGKSA